MYVPVPPRPCLKMKLPRETDHYATSPNTEKVNHTTARDLYKYFSFFSFKKLFFRGSLQTNVNSANTIYTKKFWTGLYVVKCICLVHTTRVYLYLFKKDISIGHFVHVNTLIQFEYIFKVLCLEKKMKSYYILLCQHPTSIGQIHVEGKKHFNTA